MILALLAGPVILLSREEPSILTFVTAAVNFFMSNVVLVFIFIPKFLQTKRLQDDSTNPGIEAMKRVAGLEDLDQIHPPEENDEGIPPGEIILTMKNQKELVGEIYLLKEQLEQVKEENKLLLEKVSISNDNSVKPNLSETSGPVKRSSFVARRNTLCIKTIHYANGAGRTKKKTALTNTFNWNPIVSAIAKEHDAYKRQ